MSNNDPSLVPLALIVLVVVVFVAWLMGSSESDG